MSRTDEQGAPAASNTPPATPPAASAPPPRPQAVADKRGPVRAVVLKPFGMTGMGTVQPERVVSKPGGKQKRIPADVVTLSADDFTNLQAAGLVEKEA